MALTRSARLGVEQFCLVPESEKAGGSLSSTAAGAGAHTAAKRHSCSAIHRKADVGRRMVKREREREREGQRNGRS